MINLILHGNFIKKMKILILKYTPIVLTSIFTSYFTAYLAIKTNVESQLQITDIQNKKNSINLVKLIKIDLTVARKIAVINIGASRMAKNFYCDGKENIESMLVIDNNKTSLSYDIKIFESFTSNAFLLENDMSKELTEIYLKRSILNESQYNCSSKNEYTNIISNRISIENQLIQEIDEIIPKLDDFIERNT